MIKMKKLMITVAAISALGMGSSAFAVCTKAGFIERVSAYDDGQRATHFIYMRTSALTSSY
jgi:hypothetical protein